MSLSRKIILAIAFSLISCLGSYLIISKIFSNLENQLYEKCRIEAMTGARAMSEMMYYMVKQNMLTKDAVFDTNYIEVPGSNPKKYHTRYDMVFEKWMQGILDQFLLDTDVEFAVLMDINGYVPAHNKSTPCRSQAIIKRTCSTAARKRVYYAHEGIKRILAYDAAAASRALPRDTERDSLERRRSDPVIREAVGSFIIGVNLVQIEAIKDQMLALSSSPCR